MRLCHKCLKRPQRIDCYCGPCAGYMRSVAQRQRQAQEWIERNARIFGPDWTQWPQPPEHLLTDLA